MVMVSINVYDVDGNKYAYNGADWNTATYATDGRQLNNFSNVSIGTAAAYNAAAGVSGDIVLTQTQNVYDNDGSVIETVTSDRFGTDSIIATGPLHSTVNTSTGAFARVSYSASYYDAADRDIADVNVGTNGSAGVWTPPSSAPTRSPTVLVNSTVYDPAGNVRFTVDPLGIITGYG